MVPLKKCHSPTSSAPTPSSDRFSWSTNCSTLATPLEPHEFVVPALPNENEFQFIAKARERLAHREIELDQIIHHCNSEMDIVRKKLCKDLRVMEMIKGEIEKAGTGPMRDQLEADFYDGTTFNVQCLI
jgi:hypothetical protein